MVKEFRLRRIPASFRYAFRGIWHVIRTEQNLRIHLFATLVALVLATLFQITTIELALILLAIGFVLASEILNTVIEDFLDILHPQHHAAVRRIKDALAGAVLLAALVALALGALIFLPHILALLENGKL